MGLSRASVATHGTFHEAMVLCSSDDSWWYWERGCISRPLCYGESKSFRCFELSCPNVSGHCKLAWNTEWGLTHWHMSGSAWLQADAWRSCMGTMHVCSTAFSEREVAEVWHIKCLVNSCGATLIVICYCSLGICPWSNIFMCAVCHILLVVLQELICSL